MSKLTPKQEIFCQEYLVDLNATEAARRAGYSKRSANNIGPGNLLKPIIQLRIEELKAERSARVQIDADWVLKHNSEILNADVADILDDDGSYLPIKRWPKIWRQMLNGIDVQEIFDGAGKYRRKTGEVVKIKFIDRLKALEMVGKHVEVQAFNEKHSHDHSHSGEIGVNTNQIAGDVYREVVRRERERRTIQ
jgi:phage terminase small subunit